MARTERNQTQNRHSRVQVRPRKATVVHDGSAFQLAADLRRYGFDVAEGPLLASSASHHDPGSLAVIATRPGGTRSERLHEWTHQMCWKGATLLAVGAAIGPVAEFFGAPRTTPSDQRASGRLANVGSASQGLFSGLPAEFRLALPAGDRFPHVRVELRVWRHRLGPRRRAHRRLPRLQAGALAARGGAGERGGASDCLEELVAVAAGERRAGLLAGTAAATRGTAEHDTGFRRTGRLAKVAGWTGQRWPRKPPLGARAQSAVVAVLPIVTRYADYTPCRVPPCPSIRRHLRRRTARDGRHREWARSPACIDVWRRRRGPASKHIRHNPVSCSSAPRSVCGCATDPSCPIPSCSPT